MKKLVIIIILSVMFLSISAVCANENATVSDDATILQESDTEIVAENSTDEEAAQEVVLDNSSIAASATTGYESFSTKFTVKLTSNGTALASKPVSIVINGVTYKKTTDSNGQASVSAKLKKGTYTAKYSFAGDNQTNPSSGSAKITVKSPVKTKFKVVDKNVNYRQGLRSIFQVRLLTSAGSAVKNKAVTIKAAGKTYNVKTNSKGYATAYLSLKKGTRKVTYSFKSSSPYLKSSGSTKLKVKASMGKGNGYVVWAEYMKKVNLKTLKNKATKHIFLQSSAINYYGKAAVTSWIAKATKYGMKVHIIVQAFYNGKLVSPVNKDGSLKYSFMAKKIREAKSYAKIRGVKGIHFDSLMVKNAQNYPTATNAINYFVKKACTEIRKVSPSCIISASIMPEPGVVEGSYGQDIEYMSKYLDVLMPTVFKGNYKKNTEWIGYVTQSFKLQSNAAQIWSGIQGYHSDSNLGKITSSSLLKDAKSAVSGGAKGVVVFRIGHTNYLNFAKI